MTKGWCPVHDRVFESGDGLCPECGRALVTVDDSSPTSDAMLVVPEAEDEPAVEISQTADDGAASGTLRIGPATLAAVVTAVVVVAFLAGVAFPRKRNPNVSSTPTPQARSDYDVGVERSDSEIRLRLESLSQRGKTIILRVTVPDQPGVDIGGITGVTVAPEVSRGLVLEPSPLEVRTTVFGFVGEGPVLERPDLPITGIRILSLEQRTRGNGRAVLDLSRVWGEKRRGPVASDRAVDLPFSGRRMRVVGLVGWRDHLDVQVEERYVNQGWTYSDQYKILLVDAPAAAGEQTGSIDEGASRLITVRFHECGAVPYAGCLPRGLSLTHVLTVEADSMTINGRWSWELG